MRVTENPEIRVFVQPDRNGGAVTKVSHARIHVISDRGH